MRNYKEYINNLECYKDIDLINTSGIIKINIGADSYITYGSSIVKVFTTILIQLENRNGTNKRLQKAYDYIGDSDVSIEILEISEGMYLKEKSMQYIDNIKPTLNYQRSEDGFSEDHKRNLSKSKIGEKHNRAKLTEEEAKQIKVMAIYSGMTSGEIAKMFNISPQQVRKIKLGIAWSHIVV
ncbi:hypothetical protein [Clostridium sp. ZBS15]|uniref:hypothetical protein n=1 Tax=Clostridium sp. ZBS15 TaxID=2949969 RepID=UPI00207ACCCC|nr:hypothetical protein [Clostridium sp. ZBS15]